MPDSAPTVTPPAITPPPPPVITPTPATQVPGLNTLWVHRERHSICFVAGIMDGIVVYRRLGDNRQTQLPAERFVTRLRPITVAENLQLVAALPTLRRARVGATLQTIANPEAYLPATNLVQTPPIETPAGQPSPEIPFDPNATPVPLETGGDVTEASNPRRPRRGDESDAEVGELVEPGELDVFERLVLYPEVRALIDSGLNAITNRDEIDTFFGTSRIQANNKRCGLNFFGKPGTGKTAVARAVARLLGKKLYQVNYASVISKWMGDTAKHIESAFAKATEYGAILFLDEADSLCSKRLDMSESCATSINQNRNTLMQCLDRFEDVVIFTTNIFQNYDEALLRRIAEHIEFKLPDAEMRKVIFDKHLPVKTRVKSDIDWALVAFHSDGFSGGDILNVVVNGIKRACAPINRDDWWVTQDILIAECEKVSKIKKAHAAHSALKNKKRAQPASTVVPPEGEEHTPVVPAIPAPAPVIPAPAHVAPAPVVVVPAA